MSKEPSDDVVKKEIISTISSIQIHMRQNKLRKIICKQISDTNWTQFQRVLTSAIQDGSVKSQEIDGEPMILSSMEGASAPTPNKKVLLSKDMEIPFEVNFHLYRKGQRKKKNIELNTKTSLQCDAESRKAIKMNFSGDKQQATTLTITKFWNAAEYIGDEEKAKEAKATANKQFKAAIYMIEKMVESFKKHPDHFVIKKAGGTFAEQDIAKKRKAGARKKDKDKDQSSGGENKVKRNRKFY